MMRFLGFLLLVIGGGAAGVFLGAKNLIPEAILKIGILDQYLHFIGGGVGVVGLLMMALGGGKKKGGDKDKDKKKH